MPVLSDKVLQHLGTILAEAHQQATLASLAICSTAFYRLFMPLLYHRLDLTGPRTASSVGPLNPFELFDPARLDDPHPTLTLRGSARTLDGAAVIAAKQRHVRLAWAASQVVKLVITDRQLFQAVPTFCQLAGRLRGDRPPRLAFPKLKELVVLPHPPSPDPSADQKAAPGEVDKLKTTGPDRLCDALLLACELKYICIRPSAALLQRDSISGGALRKPTEIAKWLSALGARGLPKILTWHAVSLLGIPIDDSHPTRSTRVELVLPEPQDEAKDMNGLAAQANGSWMVRRWLRPEWTLGRAKSTLPQVLVVNPQGYAKGSDPKEPQSGGAARQVEWLKVWAAYRKVWNEQRAKQVKAGVPERELPRWVDVQDCLMLDIAGSQARCGACRD